MVPLLTETDIMNMNTTSTPDNPDVGRVAGISRIQPGRRGELDIAGRHYVRADCLAGMLGVTVRTLARWDAARIGPPKIKVGKLRLYDLSKLPEWLSSRETEPVRDRRHSGRAAQ